MTTEIAEADLFPGDSRPHARRRHLEVGVAECDDHGDIVLVRCHLSRCRERWERCGPPGGRRADDWFVRVAVEKDE